MRFLLLSLLLSTLGNADVVKLVKAGLTAETIEAKIASSDADFDTSTDALVALAGAGVPDRVIRMMIERDGQPAKTPTAPIPPPASPSPNPRPPVPTQPPTNAPRPLSRRYDVTVHADGGGKCEAELRIDGKGIKATRCRTLDFELAWDRIERVCYVYGFRGELVLTSGGVDRKISVTTPAEGKRLVEHVRGNAPKVAVSECR